MTRRSLLRRLVAAAAFVAVPAPIIKASAALVEPARWYACERLREAWLAYDHAHGAAPAMLIVGRDLFELYDAELDAWWRFASGHAPPGIQTLIFKGTVVVPQGRGYGIRAVEALRWDDVA